MLHPRHNQDLKQVPKNTKNHSKTPIKQPAAWVASNTTNHSKNDRPQNHPSSPKPDRPTPKIKIPSEIIQINYNTSKPSKSNTNKSFKTQSKTKVESHLSLSNKKSISTQSPNPSIRGTLNPTPKP
jgi:hypothetical protein